MSRYKSKAPTHSATHIAPHVVRIVTRTVGVFFIFFVQNVVCRYHEEAVS